MAKVIIEPPAPKPSPREIRWNCAVRNTGTGRVQVGITVRAESLPEACGKAAEHEEIVAAWVKNYPHAQLSISPDPKDDKP